MRRLILSVICGFVIPFIYAIIAAPMSVYVGNHRLKMLLGFPVRWPLFIYPSLVFLPFPMLITYHVCCNVVVYGTLTYFILWTRASRKADEIELPKPPSFVEP